MKTAFGDNVCASSEHPAKRPNPRNLMDVNKTYRLGSETVELIAQLADRYDVSMRYVIESAVIEWAERCAASDEAIGRPPSRTERKQANA